MFAVIAINESLVDLQVDLVGGYYDAGDHVKFGLPMAFTVTMLSWGAAEYGEEMVAAGEERHVLEAIKWGTDYFVKAHTEANVLWAEVRADQLKKDSVFIFYLNYMI